MAAIKSGWHLMYTKPNQEKKISEKLSEISIRSFVPLVKTHRQWHDRKKIVEVPLFPSYVFVNIQNHWDFYKSSDLSGCVSYVKFGNQVATVSEDKINSIRIAVDKCQTLEVAYDSFHPGQLLKVSSGPFQGFVCEMVQFKGKEKALVRVNFLNRSLLVDLPLTIIEQLM